MITNPIALRFFGYMFVAGIGCFIWNVIEDDLGYLTLGLFLTASGWGFRAAADFTDPARFDLGRMALTFGSVCAVLGVAAWFAT